MQLSREQALSRLNLETAPQRLDALRALRALVDAGELTPPATGRDVNNHIHTTYSFSPYSPAAAVWFAWMAGLTTSGIMDHDTIAGAAEFHEAGHILSMGTTCGIECRVTFENTPIRGRRINNPDQDTVVYMALHGVPHTALARVNAFFAPYRAHRNDRNRRMVARVNELVAAHGIAIDFERDVLPLSMAHDGGAVTERHISCALAQAMIAATGGGASLVRFLREGLGKPVSAKVEGFLTDAANPHAMYDLLGWIKSDLMPSIYIDATDECPDVREVLALSEEVGAISAYAYLGDVGDSVTGDKRAQKFEDDYLDSLFEVIAGLGFRAVTYMPSRNTRAQLARVRALCQRYALFEISGEDINSPRQSFVCEAQRDPAFAHLEDATWALIAHEWRATECASQGFFSEQSVREWPELTARVRAFAAFGRAMKF